MFALYYTGFNYHMMGEYEVAMAYYQRSLEIKPFHREVNYNLALHAWD